MQSNPDDSPEWTDQSLIYRPKRSELIFLRCTPAEHAQLKALARQANRTMANLMRLAILQYATALKTRKDNPKKCSRTPISSEP